MSGNISIPLHYLDWLTVDNSCVLYVILMDTKIGQSQKMMMIVHIRIGAAV